jgi:hypothetical protein
MHLPLVLAFLLCSSAAMRTDNGPSVPDDSVFRTSDNERFEVAVKGVTGAKIDVRAEVFAGRHCSVPTADASGRPVLVDILVRDGEKGRKRVELKLLETLANAPARVLTLSDLLAPGESDVTGPGWNSLFEIRLTAK